MIHVLHPRCRVFFLAVPALAGGDLLAVRRRSTARLECCGGVIAALAWLAIGGVSRRVGTIYLALASPIEAFAPLLLQVHMLQHLLLMMVGPPLIWLGDPLFADAPWLAQRNSPLLDRTDVALAAAAADCCGQSLIRFSRCLIFCRRHVDLAFAGDVRDWRSTNDRSQTSAYLFSCRRG